MLIHSKTRKTIELLILPFISLSLFSVVLLASLGKVKRPHIGRIGAFAGQERVPRWAAHRTPAAGPPPATPAAPTTVRTPVNRQVNPP